MEKIKKYNDFCGQNRHNIGILVIKQNVAFYHPTLVMEGQKPLFVYFSISFIHIVLPKCNLFVVG